jgi:hypothetical protein
MRKCRYKIISKLADYSLFSFALAFSFQNLAGYLAFFLRTQFCKHHTPLLIFLLLISTTDFEKTASYFFTSNPAFSQAYVLRVQLLFSPAETSFTALSFRSFRNNFLFR